MRKPTTPSTMLITKVGVSVSLDKDDVNRRLETELYQRNIMISPYKCQFGPFKIFTCETFAWCEDHGDQPCDASTGPLLLLGGKRPFCPLSLLQKN